jgi:oligosaccharide reducing-end xylanase
MFVVSAASAADTTRNLFAELLGKSETETAARIESTWRQFTSGDPKNERLYFEVGDDAAYIADIGSQDVRSEGMSYGMMIAVQLGEREQFDRLWRWARKYMQHRADSPRRGYFAWQCRFDGTQIDPGSASDGEAWFATALFFAAHRWGGELRDIDYAADAQALLRAMRDNDRGGEITSIFDLERRQIVFAPTRDGSRLTDPSYHLPHFLELWARWDADPAGRAFWKECVAESRAFLRRAAHPDTGLMSEYAHFDGRPYTETTFGPGKGDFRYDAWRILANVAVDHAWFAADPWQVEQSNRVLRFLAKQGPEPIDQYTLPGRPLSRDRSIGLGATAAVAGLAADPDLARPFVQRLWKAPTPTGQWRYYNGLLVMLGLLQAGGRFTVIEPPAATSVVPSPRSAVTGRYRNLFAELLGKSGAETDAKIEAAWQQLFHGDPETQRILYPVHDDMAYIPDVGNRDVRSEGLSYGMMIAVQLGHQREFDQIWKYAKRFMYHEDGPMRGYFTWHTAYNGTMTRDDGTVVRGDGPAPDGEEWFVMALFFASHRWGDGEGIFNYGAEAQSLLHTMLHKDEEPDRGTMTAMFDRTTKQIVFTPHPPGDKFTDPSYHLPAFYELWARWAKDPADRAFMAEVAATSRELFRKAAHPSTGLMANYTTFEGVGIAAPWMQAGFFEDAWRTLSHPAVDWSWWGIDPWQVEQSNRILSFFAKEPADDWPDHLKLDGTVLRRGEKSPGLYAMAAVSGLAADPELARPFVQRLWDMPVPDDRGRDTDGLREEGALRSWRYYDGLLTMFGLLQAGGRFQVFHPVTPGT